MDDTGDVTEDSQQDVDELQTEVSRDAGSIHLKQTYEVGIAAALEEDSKRGKDDGEAGEQNINIEEGTRITIGHT